MRVDDIIEATIGKEGQYSNDPQDAGGETCWGCTEQVARAFGYKGPMKQMPRATAFDIYKARYWIQPRFDQVALLSEPIAIELFDTGVNMRPATAGKFLQRALNAFNLRGKLWPDVGVDGGIGAMTLSALRQYLNQRGQEGEAVMLAALNAQQGVRYMELSESRPANEDFVYGWIRNRVQIA